MLWLAIHFPQFCLDTHARGMEEMAALVVVEGGEGRQRICALNGPALHQGLMEGMGLPAAWALAPEVRVLPRQTLLEEQGLLGLAEWAGQFSAQVCMESGQGLLLEVGASLKLFRGLAELLAGIRGGLAGLGYTTQLAVAPTPMAASWLAISGDGGQVLEKPALRPALSGLVLEVAGFPPPVLEALQGMGIRHIGEILQLPRKAFTRRLGQAVTTRLDQALGRVPDPRRLHVPAAVFERHLLLPAEVHDREALLFPAYRLLDELAGYLQATQAGLQALDLFLTHAGRSETVIHIGLLHCSRDPKHLLDLLRDRLERTTLQAPVEALRLRADRLQSLAPQESDLFGAAGGPQGDWRQLVEKITARLGAGSVHGLRAWCEHRPESAWHARTPGPGESGTGVRHRPVWLLPDPRPLQERRDLPWLDGPLQLLEGPERIESGWWDGEGIERDYYRVRDAGGVHLWVYRQRRTPYGWFLHGMFG